MMSNLPPMPKIPENSDDYSNEPPEGNPPEFFSVAYFMHVRDKAFREIGELKLGLYRVQANSQVGVLEHLARLTSHVIFNSNHTLSHLHQLQEKTNIMADQIDDLIAKVAEVTTSEASLEARVNANLALLNQTIADLKVIPVATADPRVQAAIASLSTVAGSLNSFDVPAVTLPASPDPVVTPAPVADAPPVVDAPPVAVVDPSVPVTGSSDTGTSGTNPATGA